MAIVTGDRYLDNLVKFVDKQAGQLLDGTVVLKLNPVGLHYVQSRLEALQELEGLISGAPVDYLRAYISDLGDHRALEQLRRILRLLVSLKVVSVLPPPGRDPTPLWLLPFGRLKVLELRGCDLSTSAARGLLELRHSLEKIIVHNSTDALRHVFASRIVDIKDAPVWNRLSLVSCPCNGLVLMDESLQLLPCVETLDLSRNRFAKVDNLNKCTKLKHLDLGFNHLRSISSFSEVACSIVKLVFRNNALTSLRGIETFVSVEGLDLSYNIISNISELEILSSLPSLQSLWLEGNPICCAPWFRAQVFSLFAYPEKLILDDKRITTRESWERQIVLASRLKRPAGFGFYCPAKDNDEESSVNRNKKRLSRLALIEDEKRGSCTLPEAVEQESISCESEILSRGETAVSDTEAEIVDLMNRVEFLKKEHSVLWLREFKEWMDQTSEIVEDNTRHSESIGLGKEILSENREGQKKFGESSKYVSDLVHALGDESSTNILESDNSIADSSSGLLANHNFNSAGEVALESLTSEHSKDSSPDSQTGDFSMKQEKEIVSSQAQLNFLPLMNDSFHKPDEEVSLIRTKYIDEILDPQLSSSYPGSPPHYQEDILHRRYNLEEEFLQLPMESYSLASSDTDTSTSDDESCIFDASLPEVEQVLNEESANRILNGHSEVVLNDDICCDRRSETSLHVGRYLFDSCVNQTSRTKELLKEDLTCMDHGAANTECHNDTADDQDIGFLEKIMRKGRLKRRVVSLSEENWSLSNTEPLSLKENGIAEVCNGDMVHESRGKDTVGGDLRNLYDDDRSKSCSTETTSSRPISDEVIKSYFQANMGGSEFCLRSMLCDCILQKELEYKESEVLILLSSENKVYMLLVNTTSDGPDCISEAIGCHRLNKIKEVTIGIGLQVLRVHIEMDATYIFLTKSVEKSRELLSLLCVCDSTAVSKSCYLTSAEKVQVELFEKHICGGSKTNIFLYSMLLFRCNSSEEETWLSRSLFVIEGYMIVCFEDLVHFGFNTVDGALSSPYFSLDSCCSIRNISEMVIEPRDSNCVTLTLDSEKFGQGDDVVDEKKIHLNEKMATGSCKWKLKWFSEEILLKFVALLKALHAETAGYPLTIRCVS